MTHKVTTDAGDRLLDTGSGRGIIALNAAEWANASVVGVNIDETQIAHSRRLALHSGMADRVQFYEQEQQFNGVSVYCLHFHEPHAMAGNSKSSSIHWWF